MKIEGTLQQKQVQSEDGQLNQNRQQERNQNGWQGLPLYLQNEMRLKEGQQLGEENLQPEEEWLEIFDYEGVGVEMLGREEIVRDAVMGHTIPAILTEAVNGSDSKEMAAVKDTIRSWNEIRNKKLSAEFPEMSQEQIQEQIRDMELSYLDAIAACQDYCDHKRPKLANGKVRKKAVSDALELLKEEIQWIPRLREMVSREGLPEQDGPVKLLDLLSEAGIRQKLEAQEADRRQEQDRAQEVQTDFVERLTYEDFARMLTMDPEDHLEFRGQRLRVVKNGIWSKPANATSEDNKKMAERFVAVAIQQIEQKQELSQEQKANMKMRLQYQLGVKLLDTQAGTISMNRLRDTMELVDHFVSDTDRAMQEDGHASPMEYRFASAVNESLAIPSREEVKSKAIYKKLKGILKDAKKEGLDLPSVSDEELQKIVAGKLYTVRDETFHNLRQIYQSMRCLNGGKSVDFEALATNKRVINCMIALSISRMTAATSAGAEAAAYKLYTYMEHQAFAHCGNASLEAAFRETRILPLISGGKSGLRQLVTGQVSRTGQWKKEKARVLSGMNQLEEVCSLLEKLSDMQSKAFTEGLTPDEATRMQGLGTQLQELADQEKITGDMELVAQNLKGSRFAEGFKQLQELMDKPNAFADATGKIASAAERTVEEEDDLRESLFALFQEETRMQLGMEDTLQPVSSGETGELLSGLQGTDREIVAVLLQEKKPSGLIRESGDDTAKSIAALYFALRSMKRGDTFADVSVADVKFRLEKRINGDVELGLDNKRICLPFSVEFLMYRLEQDISENPDKYGDELAGHVLRDTFVQAREQETEDTCRAVFLNILNKKTGLDAAFFRNSPVELLSRIAEYALRGVMNRADIEQVVNSLTNPDQVMLNEADTLEMISVLEKQKKQQRNAGPTVVMTEKKRKENVEKAENQWTPEEAELVELLSDMVFSKDTWKTDMEKREPADRIRMLMYEHSELLAKMVKDQQLSEQFFKKLHLPGAGNVTRAVKQQLDQLLAIGIFSGSEMLDAETLTLLFRAVLGDEQDRKNVQPEIGKIKEAMKATRTAVKNASGMDVFMDGDLEEEEIPVEEMLLEQKAMLLDGFQRLDTEIDKQTKRTVKEIQKQINTSVDTLFDAKDNKKTLEQMTLEEILEQNAKGQEGQGKFFKLVLTGYFEKSSPMDQRAMLASALRDVKPAQTGKKQSEEEVNQQMGAFLGGFLKGAGPLLHKLLQGLPMEGMPESLKTAISDMKSKLSPIAPEIVEARMNKMVMNSRGMITKIEVQRSLGAASIGQAFLCKIYGPRLEKDGKDVVIKLLRPDVQNHMEREKPFMLECAKETSEGMLKTYQGQLRAIEEELDLRIEAKNVELGKVYDKGVNTVQSMKLVNLVSPDMNALMLEKAPGSTVDTYLEEVRIKYQQLKAKFEETNAKDGGYEAMCGIYQLIEGLAKRQDYVAELSKKWIVSGIYEEGFYHGDLHAGNIMVDENRATVIDFGNAMQITKEQQVSVLHMVCAALSQNVDGFRHHFHLLLSPESEATYQEKKAEFNEMLGTVLFKKGDVGIRIAVALAEAQKLGLELPAAIHNFSQCQIRLKNTVDDMAAEIQKMNEDFEKMFMYTDSGKESDPFAVIKGAIYSNIRLRLDDESGKYKNGKDVQVPSLEEQVELAMFCESFNEAGFIELYENVPQDMGNITRLHNHLKALQDCYTAVDSSGMNIDAQTQIVYKGTGKQKLQVFIDGMRNDFKINTESFNQFVRKAMDWFEQPGYNTEELGRLLDTIYDVDLTDEINQYLRCLKRTRELKVTYNLAKHRKAKNAPNLSHELIQAENELIKLAKNVGVSPLPAAGKKIQDALLTRDETEQRVFETRMKGWFEDQENHGGELQGIYNRILEMKRNQEPLGENSEPVKNFMKVLQQVVLQRARHFEELGRGREQIHPKDFYKAMEDVVKERFEQSVKRLGIVGLYRYQLKNNTKPKTDKKLLQKRKNIENLLNGMKPLLENLQSSLTYFYREKTLLEEGQKQENEEKLNIMFGKTLPENLKALPFSKEDRKELDKNLKEYQKTRQVEAVYELGQKLFQIYQDNLKYASGYVDQTAEWDTVLKSIKKEILDLEEKDLEILQY